MILLSITRTPDDSKFFLFPLKVRITGVDYISFKLFHFLKKNSRAKLIQAG